MGCITNIALDNISLDCNDVPVGGLAEVYAAGACETALAVHPKADDTDYGKASILSFAGESAAGTGKVYKLEFNKRDGVTSFTDAKTVDATGLVTVTPTLTLELPKMNEAKRSLLNKMANGNGKYLVFLKTSAGTKHVLGAKFGMKVSSVSGTTGTGRTDKNTYTITFTGEESELAYDISDVWDNVVNKVSIDQAGATNHDTSAATADAFVPRTDCIPTVSSGGGTPASS